MTTARRDSSLTKGQKAIRAICPGMISDSIGNMSSLLGIFPTIPPRSSKTSRGRIGDSIPACQRQLGGAEGKKSIRA